MIFTISTRNRPVVCAHLKLWLYSISVSPNLIISCPPLWTKFFTKIGLIDGSSTSVTFCNVTYRTRKWAQGNVLQLCLHSKRKHVSMPNSSWQFMMKKKKICDPQHCLLHTCKGRLFMFDAVLIFISMADTYFKTDEEKRERWNI